MVSSNTMMVNCWHLIYALAHTVGTPATTSQMAKDVVSFLQWAAEPEMDERKKMGFQAVTILTLLFGVSIYMKRMKWSVIKSRKLVYSPPKTK